MKKYIPFVIFCILTLLWIGFIFSNSAKSGVESGEASSAVVEVLENILEKIGLERDVSERFVRKLAHFLEYMMLSLLICADIALMFSSSELIRKRRVYFAIAPAFSFIIANIDEFCVQAATVGRGPSFKDVCIDTAGAFAGALAFAFMVFTVSAIRNRK